MTAAQSKVTPATDAEIDFYLKERHVYGCTGKNCHHCKLVARIRAERERADEALSNSEKDFDESITRVGKAERRANVAEARAQSAEALLREVIGVIRSWADVFLVGPYQHEVAMSLARAADAIMSKIDAHLSAQKGGE